MKVRAAIIFMLFSTFMVQFVSGGEPLVEDFETDTVGQAPSTSFGTWGAGVGSVTATGNGDPTGSREYEQTDTTGQFDLTTPTNHPSVGYWMDVNNRAGVRISPGINLISMVEGTGVVYNGEVGEADPMGTCTGPKVRVDLTIDYDNQQVGVTVLEDDLTTCLTATRAFRSGAATQITTIDFLNTAGGADYFDTITFGATPDPPAGLTGEVTDTTSPQSYSIQWLLSPDDTDQTRGQFTYDLYYDTGSGQTLAATIPAGGANNGVHRLTFSLAHSGNVIFYVNATNTDGVESLASCTITLDPTIEDRDSCGDSIPGTEETGSDLTDEDGALFGGDRSALAAALDVEETMLSFLVGLMLTLMLAAGGWFVYGTIGAAGLGLVGMITSYALDLFSFWVLFFFFVFAAAGITIRGRVVGG